MTHGCNCRFYGDKKAGPLSINIKVANAGYAFICQTPGNWGKLPDKFVHFWSAGTRVYLEASAQGTSAYKFDEAKVSCG